MTPNRIMFWQIDHVWLFYVVGNAFHRVLFLAGLGAHILVWKKSAGSSKVSFSGAALKKMLQDAFLGRRLIEGDVAAGLMHLFIFWAIHLPFFSAPAFWWSYHYFISFLEGPVYLIFSLIMELGRGGGEGSCCWRESSGHSFVDISSACPGLKDGWRDALVPLWLLLMVLSGFILEGLRLSSQQPAWGAWSFAGWWHERSVFTRTGRSLLSRLLVDAHPSLFGFYCSDSLLQTVSYPGCPCRHLFPGRCRARPVGH